MRRTYWDGQDNVGAYVDCEVLWSGKGSMPHEVEAAAYWRQKQNALMNAAPDRLSAVSAANGAGVPRCRCGGLIERPKSDGHAADSCVNCARPKTKAGRPKGTKEVRRRRYKSAVTVNHS
jgi:hypothetical protein